MARTKQTARKNPSDKLSRGGKAPRGLPALKKVRKGASKSASKHRVNVKKPHRFRPGTVALREIKKAQRHTGFFLRRAPFFDAVRRTLYENIPSRLNKSWRINYKAMDALQMGLEAALIKYFENGYECTLHAKRVTIDSRDLRVAGRLVPGIGNKCQEEVSSKTLSTFN